MVTAYHEIILLMSITTMMVAILTPAYGQSTFDQPSSPSSPSDDDENNTGVAEGQYNTGGVTVESSLPYTGVEGETETPAPEGVGSPGPLKITAHLKDDRRSEDSYSVDMKNYTFLFEGLTQSPKNYELASNSLGNPIGIDSEDFDVIYLGELEVRNGTIIKVFDITGAIDVYQIEQKPTGETIYYFASEDLDFIVIGPYRWEDCSGQVSLKDSVEGKGLKDGNLILDCKS
jgi:hypothetical protein